MKLLFDENTGSGVPKALRLVGFDNVNYITNMFRDEFDKGQGVADEQWIPRVGDQWLVISEDQGLLRKPGQRRPAASSTPSYPRLPRVSRRIRHRRFARRTAYWPVTT